MAVQLVPFQGYSLVVHDGAYLPVSVYGPNNLGGDSVFKTVDVVAAQEWVKAYKTGNQWAVNALL